MRLRRAVVFDKMSEREAARQFGLARETVRKMLRYTVPPGYLVQKSQKPRERRYTSCATHIHPYYLPRA